MDNINRTQAIFSMIKLEAEDIENGYMAPQCFDSNRAIKALELLPSTQKNGRWQQRRGSNCWECSECHAVLESDDIVRHNFYYCYHCGADMMDENGYMKLERAEHE